MTLLRALQKASSMLEAEGFDDHRWQARVLAAHVSGCTPGQLHFPTEISFASKKLEETFFSLVKLRISGIPLQHVIGEWDFYGRTFRVDSRALIPRPETELLVEFICATKLPDSPLILDVGTGSGVIGLSLALELPNSKVLGTDISQHAISLAEENKKLLDACNFSTCICNLSDNAHTRGPFDVVVANLPYIPSDEIPKLSPEVKDHDPVSALDGGIDGILLILELVESAPQLLLQDGLIVLETGFDQGNSVPALFSEKIWTDIQTHNDLSGNHRMVTARRR